MWPIDSIDNGEVEDMKRGLVMFLCVTGLAAIALFGSGVVSSRRREPELRSDSAEYWYPHMLA